MRILCRLFGGDKMAGNDASREMPRFTHAQIIQWPDNSARPIRTCNRNNIKSINKQYFQVIRFE